MSGIRSPSGVPSGLTGSAKSPASGQGPVEPATPAAPTGERSGLPTQTSQPQPTTTISENTPINAVVMAKTTNDNIILHTAFGNFRITTPTPLAIGSHIVFEVTELQEVISARLLALNGRKFTPPIDVRLLPTVERTVSGAEGYLKAGQLHPLEVKTGAQNLAASLTSPMKTPVSPPPSPVQPASALGQTQPLDRTMMPQPGNIPALQSDGSAKASPMGIAAYQKYHNPTLSAVQQPDVPQVASRDGLSTTNAPVLKHIVEADIIRLPSPLQIQTSKGPLPITEGTKAELIVRPQQMTGSLSPRDGLYQGTVIALANATATSSASRVTLQSPLGTLSYTTTTPPATGTTVQFAVADGISNFPLPNAEIQQSSGRLPAISAMGDWQNLREALNIVARQDPIIAQSVIQQVMPQANSQLSNNLLFFMAALNLGSIEKWLGQDFAHALKSAGRAPLLNALEDDFATFSRLQSDTGGQDWKSLNLPFFDGNNLRQVRLFYRQRKNPDGADGEKETTRFVIELNLTKSGQLQLDGLFKQRAFGLAVRSHQDIPEDMRLHIGKLFNEHMEISGLKGQLIFKTVPSFPVDPLSEWESANDGGASA